MTLAEKIFRTEAEQAVARFGENWQLLNGANIFITGGTGYFGQWLLHAIDIANSCMGMDIQATILTRSKARFAGKFPHLTRSHWLRLHQGDVRSFNYPEGGFSHIIHGAATSASATYYEHEDALTKFETSFDGSRHLLEFAVQRGINRILMLSSGSIYGALTPNMEKYTESYDVAPDISGLGTAMGQAKRAAEFISTCYAARYKLSITTARCFSFVGPRLPLEIHYAIGNFIRDAIRGDAIQVSGDGMAVRSYLYAGDLVVWLLTLLIKGKPGRAYNVGSDQAINIGDLARLVGQRLAPGKPVNILGLVDPNRSPHRYIPDISLARSELGLEVWTSLPQAIEKTAIFEMNLSN